MHRVEDAVLCQRGLDEIRPLLDDLARYCGEHFAVEEKVLRRYGYADACARSAMGARLVEQIPDVQARLGTGRNETSDLLNLLHSLEEQAGYRDGGSPWSHQVP